VATTAAGRVLAVVYMFTGVLLLSLPVGVIGSKFVKIFNEDKARRREQRLARARQKVMIREQLMQELQEFGSFSSRPGLQRQQSSWQSQRSMMRGWISTRMPSGIMFRTNSYESVISPLESSNRTDRIEESEEEHESKE